MKVSKCWKMAEFPKISIKMKNWKIFYEAQTVSHHKEIIQPPPNLPPTTYNLATSLQQTLSYGDMEKYTDIFFKNAVLGCQERG